MRILLDTNILISAALFPNGTAAKAYIKAVTYPNKGIVCDWSIDELRRVFNRKFPKRINSLNQFLAMASIAFEIIPTPVDKVPDESKIRDVKDRPILRAAQLANVDILLIDLPHHQSATRPHMSLYDRAAQFAPFAALTGYDDMVKEEARYVGQQIDWAKHP